MTAALYPAFLKLDGLRVVVVGGGTVAASKLDGLVAAGARITVVAPNITDAIRARAERDALSLIDRAFHPSHLDGARWVVAAATPDVNRDVAAAAAERGLFVNAVDDPSAADRSPRASSTASSPRALASPSSHPTWSSPSTSAT